MPSITEIILLAVIAHAHARKPLANQIADSQFSTDKSVSKLGGRFFDRALKARFIQRSDLENTMLKKPGDDDAVVVSSANMDFGVNRAVEDEDDGYADDLVKFSATPVSEPRAKEEAAPTMKSNPLRPVIEHAMQMRPQHSLTSSSVHYDSGKYPQGRDPKAYKTVGAREQMSGIQRQSPHDVSHFDELMTEDNKAYVVGDLHEWQDESGFVRGIDRFRTKEDYARELHPDQIQGLDPAEIAQCIPFLKDIKKEDMAKGKDLSSLMRSSEFDVEALMKVDAQSWSQPQTQKKETEDPKLKKSRLASESESESESRSKKRNKHRKQMSDSESELSFEEQKKQKKKEKRSSKKKRKEKKKERKKEKKEERKKEKKEEKQKERVRVKEAKQYLKRFFKGGEAPPTQEPLTNDAPLRFIPTTTQAPKSAHEIKQLEKEKERKLQLLDQTLKVGKDRCKFYLETCNWDTAAATKLYFDEHGDARPLHEDGDGSDVEDANIAGFKAALAQRRRDRAQPGQEEGRPPPMEGPLLGPGPSNPF